MIGYGESKIGSEWRGYYITAYGLAVKHGFQGTEEEWLDSLHGADVEMRYENGILQWKHSTSEEWHTLEEFSVLQELLLAQGNAAEAAAALAKERAQAAQEAKTEANVAATTANSSAAAANEAAGAAAEAGEKANNAANNANEKAQLAGTAAANASEKAQAAEEATTFANTAAGEARAAKEAANAAAELANSKAADAETAAEQANTAAGAAQEAKTAADTAAAAANTAAETAQSQGNYAKAQGDRAAKLVGQIENTDVGGMAADILALQSGKADLVDGKVPEGQLPKLFSPQLVITSPKGNTLECKNGDYTLSGISTGLDVFTLPDYGTWEISCAAGKTMNTETVDVDTVKQYPVVFTGYSAVLKNNSWEDIASASESGIASDLWEIGDEIDIDVDGETLTFQIYDFNHDDLTGDGKAGITFGMKNLMAEGREMNASNTNADGFTGSAMYEWLQNTLFPALPEGLKSLIKAVDKKTLIGRLPPTYKTESMKLFLFSTVETGLRMEENAYKGQGGETYPIFTNNTSRVKRSGYSQRSWWQRSIYLSETASFCTVNMSGSASYLAANGIAYVCFGFCI